jgi:tetratricopeptide (TPR) repeat protein
MTQDKNDNPDQASNEALLRFLDTAPLGLARAGGRAPADGITGGMPDGMEDSAEAASADCPSAGSYTRVALGAVEDKEAEKLLAHATTCKVCGDQLVLSLNAVEGAPSQEEATAIAELAAAKASWQEAMARELAATKARKRPVLLRFGFGASPHPGRYRRWGLAGAGIAAGLLAAATLFVWQRRIHAPEHLLAMAYSQSRTLELRIPGANFAGLTSGGHTRGATGDNESAPLLEARADLARNLARSPQDAHWLELQARADVLEERYDSATDVLDRLISSGPVTPELLADAAVAYYQRGLVSGSELDRSTALDYLRRADELAPTDPVILFNEAIVMEDRGQMMNAVEVWNRYITVESDAKWAGEGKRKLAALEQTLNRLKSHESRVNQMLATPEAMDALAGDAKRLAALDEELSSVQLDKILRIAYPVMTDTAHSSEAGQARGSPCTALCMAARKLLKATANSLELQHHDFWLTDLVSADIDSLPVVPRVQFTQAIQDLGQAAREDQTGVAAEGASRAFGARKLFLQLKAGAGANASLRAAADAGEERAAVEYMFALQRHGEFSGCRTFAGQLRAEPHTDHDANRYPWIETVASVTEKVCDDTPETRDAGRKLEQKALHLAEDNNYQLLVMRIHMRLVDDAQNAGDKETAEQIALATLRQLYSGDPPAIRILNTIDAFLFIERDSPYAHETELYLKEALAWYELAGSYADGSAVRVDLARAEMRIGATAEADHQLQLAFAESNLYGSGKSKRENFNWVETLMAESMLERGDIAGAKGFLDRAFVHMTNVADTWELRMYAADRGQLDLSQEHYEEAARTLESYIRSSEGKDVRGGDRKTTAEYAELDHDLYAELAATWLAEGRSPESVLALWERFRLRSRGLPIEACGEGTLDCEQTALLAEQHRLGSSLLIGQIVLMDRVLVYRADTNGVTWSEKRLRRQDVLDAAQTLERAVSSPFTSLQTAEQLGAHLSDTLLPSIPASFNGAGFNRDSPDAALLLEADPELQNLSWAVLPTTSGPLGLRYPLAEMRSILADTAAVGEADVLTSSRTRSRIGDHALVVGASEAAQGEPPLPEVIDEARSVDAYLRSPQLLLGNEATAASVAQALGSATIFHFAGHAVRSGNGTELLLAASGSSDHNSSIDGAFLRQHRPRACRLAVLSACATGVREAAWNHPLQDIVETLGSLGVPEVVATRWQIDSEAAVPFMDSFYTSLSRGTSVAEALTSARRVQSEKSLYKNPYYWAAYYVTGRETTRLTGEFNGNVQRAGLEGTAQTKEKYF